MMEKASRIDRFQDDHKVRTMNCEVIYTSLENKSYNNFKERSEDNVDIGEG